MPVVFNPFTGNLDLINNTAVAAGSDTQVQFNDGGVLGGDSGLVFNKTTNALTGGAFIPTSSTVPTNGVYLPSANNVGISANSVGRLFVAADGTVSVKGAGTAAFSVNGGAPNNSLVVDSSGRVGLGTSSPTGLLTVAASFPVIDWTFASNTALKHSIEATGYGSLASSNSLAIKVANGSGSQATVMTLNGAGKVGVGTTSPSSELHVQNGAGNCGLRVISGTSGESSIYMGDTSNQSEGSINYSQVSNSLYFITNNSERARIDSSGRLLVGTSSQSGGALLQVNGDRVRIATAKTPASASDTGTTGEVCWDASYIYVCTATNTWKRAALSTW